MKLDPYLKLYNITFLDLENYPNPISKMEIKTNETIPSKLNEQSLTSIPQLIFNL